jgi:hypothetical protein
LTKIADGTYVVGDVALSHLLLTAYPAVAELPEPVDNRCDLRNILSQKAGRTSGVGVVQLNRITG